MNETIWYNPATWEKLKLSKSDSQKKFESLCENNLKPSNLNSIDKKLRDSLAETVNTVIASLEESNLVTEYNIDLYVGLDLYEILNTKFGFCERLASQDDIWRYLSIVIIPDIIHKRHGLKASRYFEHPRRIWLKSLWWYIHLSWQGSKEKTFEILKHNTTDNIVQLIERTGLNGYRVEFSRKLMSELYYRFKDLPGSQRTSLFRRIQKLSTARTKVIEPNLIDGGIDAYVKGLFEYFVKSN